MEENILCWDLLGKQRAIVLAHDFHWLKDSVRVRPHLKYRMSLSSLHFKRMHIQKMYTKDNKDDEKQSLWMQKLLWEDLLKKKKKGIFSLSLESRLRYIVYGSHVTNGKDKDSNCSSSFSFTIRIRGIRQNYQKTHSKTKVEFFVHWRAQLCPCWLFNITEFYLISKSNWRHS